MGSNEWICVDAKLSVTVNGSSTVEATVEARTNPAPVTNNVSDTDDDRWEQVRSRNRTVFNNTVWSGSGSSGTSSGGNSTCSIAWQEIAKSTPAPTHMTACQCRGAGTAELTEWFHSTHLAGGWPNLSADQYHPSVTLQKASFIRRRRTQRCMP